MRYRRLGKTELEVSEIGFGTSALGGQSWGVQDDRQSMKALERAFELGVNFFDTALTYGYGHAERLLGDFIRREKIRDKIIIATKVPPMNFHWPATEVTIDQVYPIHHILNLTKESQRNLRMNTIDILQLHVWADHFADDDQWWDAMQQLKEEEAIRFIGVSVNKFEPNSILRLMEMGRVDVVQVHYNIFEQAPEDALFAAAKAHDIGIIARSPLEESALAGKLTETTRFSEGDQRSIYFAAHRLGETVERVEKARSILEGAGASMPQAAIRFCLSHPAVSTVIPGMRSVEQVDDNIEASNAGSLSVEVIQELRAHRWERTSSW